MSLRFLVVEDDPASREFVRSTLAPAATIHTARTLAEAGALCAEHPYTLLLLDVSLPDGEGDAWLARQRTLGNAAPAVALTADLDRERRARLLASGFVEALGKPIGENALRQALSPWLAAAPPQWDDAQALSAVGGSSATLERLRQLFLDELPQQRERITTALDHDDIESLRAVLHQMRAGCGFVGASALAADVDALHRAPVKGPTAEALLLRIDQALAAPRH